MAIAKLLWACAACGICLAACTDPNAGKFPANKDQVLLQGRAIESPLQLP